MPLATSIQTLLLNNEQSSITIFSPESPPGLSGVAKATRIYIAFAETDDVNVRAVEIDTATKAKDRQMLECKIGNQVGG